MKWGLTVEQDLLLQKLVIAPLKQFGCRVYIFGSRAKGRHHSHSDLDLLYKLPENKILPPGFLAKIKEDIEESRFPFTVDLVNEDELAKSYQESVFTSRFEI